MKFMLGLAMLIGLTSPAFARDSAHLVCSGFMSSTPGNDNYGIAVLFDEYRAGDGQSRQEILSSVWQTDLYQGSRMNRNDGFGKNGSIVLAAKDDSKKIFFSGKYNLVQNTKNQSYALQLNGRINLEPTANAPTDKINTSLKCVNISN